MDITEKRKISLSIITPLHRISDLQFLISWVPEALNENVEVILVLDSLSESERIQILSSLPQNPDLLRITHGKFKSAANSRNHGLKQASGEWIAFWDADDRPVINSSLALIGSAMNQTVLKGNFRRKSDRVSNEIMESSVQTLDMRSVFSIAKDPGLWRWIFHNDVLNGVEFPNIEIGEDQLFLIRVLSKRDSFLNSSLVVYIYNDLNLNSISKSYYAASNFFKACCLAAREMSTLRKMPSRTHLLLFILFQIRSAFRAVAIGKWRVQRKARVLIPISGGLGNQLFQCYAGTALIGQLPDIDITLGSPRKNLKSDPDLVEAIPALRTKIVSAGYKPLKGLATKVFGYCTSYSTQSKGSGICQQLKKVTVVTSASIIFSIYFGRFYRTLISSGIGDINSMVDTSRRKYILIGYFQTQLPFGAEGKMSHTEFINTYIADPGKHLDALSATFNEETLVVHMRLTDYLFENQIGCLSPEYFKQTILLFEKEVKQIIIFSDSEEMAYGELKDTVHLPVKVLETSTYSSFETMIAMSKSTKLIISNSSFSWWAAKIATSKKSCTIVAPDKWFSKLVPPKFLIPSDWHLSQSLWRSNVESASKQKQGQQLGKEESSCK